QRLRRLSEAVDVLMRFESDADASPETQAQYERTIACALVSAGQSDLGRWHFDRAQRIYRGLQHAPGLIELDRAWTVAAEQTARTTNDYRKPESAPRPGANLLQNISMLLMHAGRPELIATGLVSILADSSCVISAAAIARAADGT